MTHPIVYLLLTLFLVLLFTFWLALVFTPLLYILLTQFGYCFGINKLCARLRYWCKLQLTSLGGDGVQNCATSHVLKNMHTLRRSNNSQQERKTVMREIAEENKTFEATAAAPLPFVAQTGCPQAEVAAGCYGILSRHQDCGGLLG